ncbi:MAG: hypothetical protein OXH15_06720 [Gammaproteobacteria bacterium]|nr:hypothetical protein [Gammaproteobacteria bacterium]
MSEFLSRIGGFAAGLLAGGTFEIVVLVVLVVIALIVLAIALWLLWKLLVLLGKGLVWLVRWGSEAAKRQSAEKRAARLAAPPRVSTAWGSSPRIGLRKAIAEARRRAGPDALVILVVAGEGTSDLCSGFGVTPPAVGSIGIAAGTDVIFIDAAKADTRMLRSLAAALPWRRPVDGVAAAVGNDGVPPDMLVRAATFARASGFRVALHLVMATGSMTAAWRIVDSANRNGADLCTQLAQDATRIWLAGGDREGLGELSHAQSADLSIALDRAIAAAPSSSVDIASVCIGGRGLRSAVAHAAARTRPAETPGVAAWLGLAGLVVGVGLAGLAAVSGLDKSEDLRATVALAAREASAAWLVEEIDAVPSGSKVRRVAGVSAALSEFSEFSFLAPLSVLIPGFNAPARLGGSLLEAYVLRPMASALDRRARTILAPSDDPVAWVGDAQLVDEWLVAWEGLGDDPTEVDLRRLLADAFGGEPEAWPEGLDVALAETASSPPEPMRGGLDVDGLAELARGNFVATMQRWAGSVYTNGPVALAARRAVDRSAVWHAQQEALSDLRTALQDPGQVWLTAAEDTPDYGYELRILGRALALTVLGQTTALEAKAAVSRIRIDAREAAEHFILPEVGPLMVRSSTGSPGGGGGPSLSLTPEAQAWLAFLDRLVSAGFADVPRRPLAVVSGPVTVDPSAVTATLGKLRTFDRFAANLPADLPPAVAGGLLLEVASELVGGVAASVEIALRSAAGAGWGSEGGAQLSRVTPALEGLQEIESWLRERQAEEEADRVLAVRARVAENVLAVGGQMLAAEDPLGVYIDPSADANATVRRFGRGVERLRRLFEIYGEPYIDAAARGGKATAYRWRDIGEDLAGFDRGDAGAALAGLEGMIRAYADDPEAACAAPRPGQGQARDDYVASALARFRVQLDDVCAGVAAERAERLYAGLAEYFTRNVAWMWPFSRDAKAPEVPDSTLGEFVARLYAAADALMGFDGAFAPTFRANAAFWDRDEDGAAVLRFRVDWRARPEEERLAEHVIVFEFEGVERDEGGIYTWRYGTAATLRMRLAKNSPYRFAFPADSEGLEFAVAGQGNGAILRLFDGLANGTFEIRTEVVDGEGGRRPLVATARVGDESGAPLTMPRFDAYPASAQALEQVR